MPADERDPSFVALPLDVVLFGYNRRQVRAHISRLQRVVDRLQSDIASAHSQADPAPQGMLAARPRPTPGPRAGSMPPGRGRSDGVGIFTDRMHPIVQAAEKEAGDIREKAHAAAREEEERATAARAAEEKARTSLAKLVRQRDAVLAEYTRVRGQLEALLAGPTTRITLPTQEIGSAVEVGQEDDAVPQAEQETVLCPVDTPLGGMDAPTLRVPAPGSRPDATQKVEGVRSAPTDDRQDTAAAEGGNPDATQVPSPSILGSS